MLVMKIVLKNADDSVEQLFWDFIENNEICTVQPDCDKNENGDWVIEIVPQWDDTNTEFLDLCKALADHLTENGYNV